jgi:hypothetical protein
VNGFRLGSIGNARRGDCTGPGYFQTDLAFYKNISLTDRVRLQFRWDIFNIFNNTNFLFQGLNTTMGLSGVCSTRTGPRSSATNVAASFGQATRARDPRQMQFGFKILW